MPKLTYGEQLKHPNWQRKRLERLTEAKWECESCGAKENTLHVHHRQYIKGRMAWEYENVQLEVLCESCHEDAHAITDELRELLTHSSNTSALALLKGFRATDDWYDPSIGYLGHDRDPHTWACGFIAYLASSLSSDQLLALAEHVASLYPAGHEARQQWFSHKTDFLELG